MPNCYFLVHCKSQAVLSESIIRCIGNMLSNVPTVQYVAMWPMPIKSIFVEIKKSYILMPLRLSKKKICKKWKQIFTSRQDKCPLIFIYFPAYHLNFHFSIYVVCNADYMHERNYSNVTICEGNITHKHTSMQPVTRDREGKRFTGYKVGSLCAVVILIRSDVLIFTHFTLISWLLSRFPC